jgi:hypothetical protein
MSGNDKRAARVAAAIVLPAAAVAALLTGPGASAVKASPAKIAPAKVVSHSINSSAASASTGGWKWTKVASLAKASKLKVHDYGTYGLACPTTKLCIVPMDGNPNNAPYNSPAGTFISTDGGHKWKFVKWSEDYEPGDSLSSQNIFCDQGGSALDCIIVGSEPVAGTFNETYGATVFQTSAVTKPDWGAADVDSDAAGFGAVSCWVNVQCAEVDSSGNAYTTVGATVTSATDVFPNLDTSGVEAVGCAPYRKGQRNAFCAAVDENGAGTIAWTLNPGASDTKWVHANIHHATLFNVSCFGPGDCLLNNDGKLVLTKGDTKAKSWTKGFKTVKLPTVGATVGTIDCTSKLCAVAGSSSKVGQWLAVSTDPAHGHWHVTLLNKSHKAFLQDGIADVSCSSAKSCVVENGYGQVAIGRK